MSEKMEKYAGRRAEMIYQDKNGKLTHRRIHVQSVSRNKVRAFDLNKRAPRVFEVDRILAVVPVDHAV
jgi:predicted DNA-binding transcriptional regulator YafY